MFQLRYAFISLVVFTLGAPTLTYAQTFRAILDGYQENPSVSTTASGTFEAEVDENAKNITYTLSYEDIETDVSFAHIHFARVGVNGGVIVWLCNNAAQDAPANTQACPQGGGEITGTISSNDVVGPEKQGIAAGEFDELVRAMKALATYINVHTAAYPPGEIRGQVVPPRPNP